MNGGTAKGWQKAAVISEIQKNYIKGHFMCFHQGTIVVLEAEISFRLVIVMGQVCTRHYIGERFSTIINCLTI